MTSMRTLTHYLARTLTIFAAVAVSACGSDKRTTPVTPEPTPIAASVTLEPADTTVSVEDTVRFRATARTAAGVVIPNAILTYVSTAPLTVEQVGAQGIASRTGTTTITVTTGGVSAGAVVRVRTRILTYELPSPSNSFAEVYGVDDAGTVIGGVYGRGGEAFTSGAGSTLTILTGASSSGPSQARAIGPTGMITGYVTVQTSFASYHLATWTKAGVLRDRGSPGVTKAIGIGVAADSTILVIYDRLVFGSPRDGALLLSPSGATTILPTLITDGYFLPTAMSSDGSVVGLSTSAAGPIIPVIWRGGNGTQAISGLPASAVPNAVASQDRVVGTLNSNVAQAFSWTSAGGMRQLGTLGGVQSQANAINDAGTIVGAATLSNGFYHACIWTDSTGIIDIGAGLNGWTTANAVSPGGIVAGLLYPPTSPAPGIQQISNKVIVWVTRRRK